MVEFWVNGIVSHRDQQPYVQLSNEKGMIAQLSVGQAVNIALDILRMTFRTEMDAMLWDFCRKQEFPEAAGAAMMMVFRDYRAKLDQEKIETKMSDPDTGEER